MADSRNLLADLDAFLGEHRLARPARLADRAL